MYDDDDNNGEDNNGDSCIPLYDNNGNVRMVLGVGSSGEPGIRMYDQNGVQRLFIGLADGHPMIAFCNEKNEPSFLLHPKLFSFGEDGKGMFEMRPGAGGALKVEINGKNGKSGLTLGVLDDAMSLMILSDKAGMPRVGMCIDGDGNPGLNLSGADGKLDWQPEIAMPTKGRRRKAV